MRSRPCANACGHRGIGHRPGTTFQERGQALTHRGATLLVDEAAISLAGRRGDLEGEIVQIFARVFTEEELTAIADFYETEAGKKFLSETPVIIREIDRASRVWSNGVQRDLAEAVREKMTAAGLQ